MVSADDVVGEPAAERRLPGRRLTQARRHDIAHDAFVHDAGSMPGAAHGFTDDHRPKLRRGEFLERTEKFPGRQADRREDDRVHRSMLTLPVVTPLYRQHPAGRR